MRWDFSVVWRHTEALLNAFLVSLGISVAAIAVGTVLGVVLGVVVLSENAPVRWGARALIEAFLALPVLVLIIWLYYCLPLFFEGVRVSGIAAAVAGMGLSLSAFVAEIVRAGINSIPKGQVESAKALGMSRYRVNRHIVLPQALRRGWPPLMGQFITTYKLSTLASVVAVQELLHTGSIIITQSYRPLEIYTAVAVVFLVTTIPLNALLHKVERVDVFGGIRRL